MGCSVRVAVAQHRKLSLMFALHACKGAPSGVLWRSTPYRGAAGHEDAENLAAAAGSPQGTLSLCSNWVRSEPNNVASDDRIRHPFPWRYLVLPTGCVLVSRRRSARCRGASWMHGCECVRVTDSRRRSLPCTHSRCPSRGVMIVSRVSPGLAASSVPWLHACRVEALRKQRILLRMLAL